MNPRQAFQDADDLWQIELEAAFGVAAGDMRYAVEGKGRPGSPLRAAYVKRTEAFAVWEASKAAVL